jgi:hypothetical protein
VVVDIFAICTAIFTMVCILLGTTRAFVVRHCEHFDDTHSDAIIARMSRLVRSCLHMFTSRDGASWRCFVTVLRDGASWRCFVTVLRDGASWRCFVTVLRVCASWRCFVYVTMVLTLKKECIELSSVYMY